MTDTQKKPFRLEEATIDELHAAIRAGETSVAQIVEHYIARVRAYNGVASLLVTEDGATVAESTGAVRAGAPLHFPTETVRASTIFPDLDKYQGPPLEFGRIVATASDPSVQQQYGMIAGKPNAGQLNALATLNIRGERSVTCKGEFDRHPSLGPLPPGAPPVCDEFRHLPASLGSSSGSAVSVSANLVMCSLGEETRASTRGPANHNAIALILPHKAMLGFNGGAIGADIYCDRSGIMARTIADCAKVLDALRNPDGGYYDPRDPYTAVPRSSVLPAYAEHAHASGATGALKGMRIGVIRESMLVRPGEKATQPICSAAAAEIKAVLGGKLGATLVESSDPLWERDRDLEAMNPDFRQALARLVPVFMPDLLFRLGPDGTPLFKEFAAAIRPTEFLPGQVFGTGTMLPIDYCVALADGQIAPPANLDIATIQQQELAPTFRFHITQYLGRRAADWQVR